uniref:FGENESH: predicted gene_5.593 protein n=1 Tax=Rhodotorula toruloides TaxID=5286 RepID=A0A0K3CF27_RHOTO
MRKALGLSSPNGTSLNGRSPPLTANNLPSSVSPTRTAAPSTSQIVKPKPIHPAPPPAAGASRDNHPASRQEPERPEQRTTASSSSAAPATSSAARNDARQANDDQLPLNGRPDLENRQSATASQVGASEAPARAKDAGDDSDIEILSEVPAIAAVGNTAPAPQGFAGSVSSRSPTPQRAAEPENSRSPTPVPRHQRNLRFAGSSSPEAGEVGDQLEVQAGLLADEEDNEDDEDERDEVPLRRTYSRVVPDSDEEGAGPSAPALGRPPAAPRSNVSLNGNAKAGSAVKAPRRTHQVARAMSGGFTARKSTTLSRPQSILPARVQADEDHLQGLPGSATVKTAPVDESVDGSSPAAQPAPRPAANEQIRPAPPAARPGVAKKSTVMTRPPPAPPAPSKPASAPSSKRNAEGPPSDASDAANRAKRPRRAAAAAADAAKEKSAQKARKTPRQRAETTAASPVAQVLGSIAIAGDDAEKPTTETLQVTNRADLEMRVEEFVRRQQVEQPWNRVIAGPSYDRLDEFSTDIQDAVNRRERRSAELHPDELPVRVQYKEIFEQMILEANSKEYPPTAPGTRPKIRVCGPADAPPEAWSSPPFEFIYTNRECNLQCGCGPECINRVVGQRKGISVDIFWTGIAGWGVRLSKDYEGDLVNGSHLSSRVRRGAPLAIYAVGEEIKARAPRAVAKKLAIAAPEASHKTTSPGKTKIKGKSVDDVPPVNADLPFDNEGFSSFYSIDAYNYGNWTRFANHVCEGFNVVPRPVYVDEGDVTRPLWVYFASRDILPGEEINISYFGESEPNPQDYGMTDAEWISAANKQRAEAPAAHRCYCNKRLCRGRMFHVAGEMFWEKREAGN